MGHSKSGQTLTEVLTTAVILGVVVLLSANAYSNYGKADAQIRESLVKASFGDNFSQLSSDPYLVQEMFLEVFENRDFKECLQKGSQCPKKWEPLEIDRSVEWAYSSEKLGFSFRSVVDEVIEIRMTSPGNRPLDVWISRFDYMNLNGSLTELTCPHKQVIAGVDYQSKKAICLIPTPGTAEKATTNELN